MKDFYALYFVSSGVLTRNAWMHPAMLLIVSLAFSTGAARDAMDALDGLSVETGFSLFGACAYLVFYCVLVLIIAFAWTNLCAKRFRLQGFRAPLTAASVGPMMLGAACSLRWLSQRLLSPIPEEILKFCYSLAAFISAWTFYQMLRPDREFP